MYQVGLHIGYWWGTSAEASVFDMLELTSRAKLEVMEINPAWLLELSESQCGEFKRRAADLGVAITLNGGLVEATDISSDSEEVRKNGADYCIAVLRKMPAMGITVWSGVNYSAWLRAPKPESDILEEKARARSHAIASLARILPIAEDLGIDYCFEVVNRYEQFIFNTAGEATRFALETGSPRAKIHLDTFHMNIEEDCMAAAIVKTGKSGLLGHLHVGGSNRGIPTTHESNIDWRLFADAVQTSGYTGPLILEPFVLPGAFNAKRTRVWRYLDKSDNPEDLVQTAAAGATFLRSLFR